VNNVLQIVTKGKNMGRGDYPQISYVDKNDVQWIEVNRGCLRQCSFCYADPNYKTFPVPKIERRVVQIIGEGFLYDKGIKTKIVELGNARVSNRVVYYGLSRGIDFRLLDNRLAELLSKNRVGIINNKGRWYKGMRFAWDGGMGDKALALKTIETLIRVGYKREHIQVFVLANWKIPFDVCVEKLDHLKEWGVKVDDCMWNTTKREKLPLYWTKEQLAILRKKSRKHNQLINFKGYDPEQKVETNEVFNFG